MSLKTMYVNEDDSPKVLPVLLSFLGVFSIFLLFFSSFKIINTGNKGLVFKFGAIQDKVLDEGFYFKMPIKTKIKEVSLRPIPLNTNIEVGENGAITKDNQTVGVEINSFYIFSKDSLVNMWKKYGTDKIESIVAKTIKEDFKIVIGKYDIFSVAENKGKIKKEVLALVKQDLENYPITITEVKINNYDWSDEFDKQIEITMQKAQQVKQAAQDLLITEKNAQKQVKEAEGKKEAAKLNAEAKALEGEGIRKYNESIRATKDIELSLRKLEIEKNRVEKWNGVYVPNNVYSPIPLSQGGIQGR